MSYLWYSPLDAVCAAAKGAAQAMMSAAKNSLRMIVYSLSEVLEPLSARITRRPNAARGLLENFSSPDRGTFANAGTRARPFIWTKVDRRRPRGLAAHALAFARKSSAGTLIRVPYRFPRFS